MIKQYKSTLDNRFDVIILDNTHREYKNFKPYFEKYGDAFLTINKKTKEKIIILDGEVDWTLDTLLFTEAHEIIHYIKNIDSSSAKNEMNVDGHAVLYLQKKKLFDAAKAGIDAFKIRNGITFKEWQKQLLNEMPHIHFGNVPLGRFKNKYVDFRVEKLPIGKSDKTKILTAFQNEIPIMGRLPNGKYVIFKGSQIFLSNTPNREYTFLPNNWEKYIIVSTSKLLLGATIY